MSEETETRIIVISPSSEVTPDHLTRRIHALELPITIKETCYGTMIEGERSKVREALKEARKLDPHRIYSKIRGFPIGDTRRCRAHHGSRPGFSQLEKEWEDLTMIDKGLSAVDEPREGKTRSREKRERLPVDKLRKIVEEVTE
ncbi:MAG: methanogenesis marker 6 protein [Methanomassiliicoccales archaeon]